MKIHKKRFKTPTKQSLTNAALHYLERYAASEASLRKVLKNRLRRAAMRIPEFADDLDARQNLESAIEEIIASHKKSGVINDGSFAEMKIHSLRRKGKSRRAIKMKLAEKGINAAIVDEAITQHEQFTTPEEAEMQAAFAFAKRKKLGKFGKSPDDPNKRRKDFAALAREGFSSNIARAVLEYTEDQE